MPNKKPFPRWGGQLLFPVWVLREPSCFYNILLLKTSAIPARLGLPSVILSKNKLLLRWFIIIVPIAVTWYIYQDSNYIFRCKIYSLNTVMDGHSWDRLLVTWAGHPVASQLGYCINMRYLQSNDCALSVQRGSDSTAQTFSILLPNSQRSRDVDSFTAASCFQKSPLFWISIFYLKYLFYVRRTFPNTWVTHTSNSSKWKLHSSTSYSSLTHNHRNPHILSFSMNYVYKTIKKFYIIKA